MHVGLVLKIQLEVYTFLYTKPSLQRVHFSAPSWNVKVTCLKGHGHTRCVVDDDICYVYAGMWANIWSSFYAILNSTRCINIVVARSGGKESTALKEW